MAAEGLSNQALDPVAIHRARQYALGNGQTQPRLRAVTGPVDDLKAAPRNPPTFAINSRKLCGPNEATAAGVRVISQLYGVRR